MKRTILPLQMMSQNNKNEMWLSKSRTGGDLAGVFEYDGQTGYFYLYNVCGAAIQKVSGAIHIISELPDFDEKDVLIRWSADENFVGLLIRSQLWAVFDSGKGIKYGGNYKHNTSPAIAQEIAALLL